MKPRIVFLAGPTASGKTALSLSLAKAIGAEIISCDSMQVYRGMDILTSKPSAEQRRLARHHLIGCVDPAGDFNVSRYRTMALEAVRRVIRRGKTPLFVGGTGLYMSALADGIFEGGAEDAAVREKLSGRAQRSGSAALHRRLSEVDPQAAQKIHPNDAKRIIRALEVYLVTGKPISQLQRERSGLRMNLDVRIFCLSLPRKELYRRIDRRVEAMFAQGLVAEVRRLLKGRPGRTAKCAIGINEVKGYLDGEYGLDTAKAMVKRNTRLYAKRQLTWFRKDKSIVWVDASSPSQAKQKILGYLRDVPRGTHLNTKNLLYRD